MKIDGPCYIRVPFVDKSSSDEATKAGSAFASAMERATGVEADAAKAGHADFRNMSRPALFDWMNTMLKSGQLSVDDSAGILAMANTQGVGDRTAEPTGNLNFYEVSRDAIESARRRNEDSAERMFQTAVGILQKFQARTDIMI